MKTEKKITYAPRFRQQKAFLRGPEQVAGSKTDRNPCPFNKWGTGADMIKMIADYR